MRRRSTIITICLAVLGAACGGQLLLAQGSDESNDLGWYNSTELSLVVTEGNSETQTVGFKNMLGRRWRSSRLKVKLDAVRSDTADDRFLLLEPGLTWAAGDDPPPGQVTLVKPSAEPDVEKYFAEIV